MCVAPEMFSSFVPADGLQLHRLLLQERQRLGVDVLRLRRVIRVDRPATPVILIETFGLPEPLVTSVLTTFSWTSMKPHWWHLTAGPVTVTFVTTFFLHRRRRLRGCGRARARSPACAKSTAEQKRTVRDRRSTAKDTLQGEPLDV